MSALQFAGVVVVSLLLIAAAWETWIIGGTEGPARGYRVLKWAVLVLALLTIATLLPACGTARVRRATPEQIRGAARLFEGAVRLEDLRLPATRGANALHWASCREGSPQDLFVEGK